MLVTECASVRLVIMLSAKSIMKIRPSEIPITSAWPKNKRDGMENSMNMILIYVSIFVAQPHPTTHFSLNFHSAGLLLLQGPIDMHWNCCHWPGMYNAILFSTVYDWECSIDSLLHSIIMYLVDLVVVAIPLYIYWYVQRPFCASPCSVSWPLHQMTPWMHIAHCIIFNHWKHNKWRKHPAMVIK